MPIMDTNKIYKGVCEFSGYDLTIEVDLKTYDDARQFYYIGYTWDKNGDDMHPFEYDTAFKTNHIDGEIIAKNELADKLIEFLTMSNSELEKVSGSVFVEDYRVQIMKSIALFWD